MLSCDKNTTHGLRRLHRCFSAVCAAFTDNAYVVVADMPNWLLPLLLLVFDSEWALSFEMAKLVAVMTYDTRAVPAHHLDCGAASCDAL